MSEKITASCQSCAWKRTDYIDEKDWIIEQSCDHSFWNNHKITIEVRNE